MQQMVLSLITNADVINIVLPPLRDRREDVVLLAEHFLKRQAKQSGQSPRELSNEALDIFLRYSWPGHVREIENEIMRACALSSDIIRPEHLSRNRGGTGLQGERRSSLSWDALRLLA